MGWTEIRSGVPHVSVLGLLFFIIFIDDIEEEVLCEISKFADDTKIATLVNSLNDIRSMQRILDKLVVWAIVLATKIINNDHQRKRFG